ncbi:hypothetical protein FGIG_12673, partial [Fasciola gigantica]
PLQLLRSRGLRGLRLLFASPIRFLSLADAPKNNLMFNPKRVLILSKITRYEFEGSVIGVSDEQQIRSAVSAFNLKRKGLNVDALLARHQVHHEKLSEFRKQLR